MAEIRNLTRNGETFYPQTHVEGVLDPEGNYIGHYEENPEYLKVELDNEGKILMGIRNDGTVVLGVGYEIDGNVTTTIDNPEFLIVYLDRADHILWGIRKDGSILFSNVPQVVKDYVEQILKPIKEKLNNVGDYIDNPEFIEVKTDFEDKILEAIRPDGIKVIPAGIELRGNTINSIMDPENRSEMTLDGEEKVISCRKFDGTLVENAGIETNHLELTKQGMTDFQQALKDAGFNPGGGGDWSDREIIEVPEPASYALLNLIIDRLPRNDGEVSEGYAEYYDKAGNYFKIGCSVEPQGQTSKVFAMTGGKGNYTLDVIKDIKFGSWVPQDSFHLKGCAKDVVRGTLSTSYKWAYMMQEFLDARPNRILVDESGITTTSATGDRMNDWPIDARCLPDGFPFELYVNGEYHGLYAWQLKKHRKNYSMDKKDYTSCFIDADGMMSNDYQHGLWNDGPDAADPDGVYPKWWNGFDIKGPKDLVCMDGSAFDGDNPKELIDSTSPYYDSSNKKHKGSAQTKAIIRGFSTKYLEVESLINSDDIVAAKAKFEENFDKKACIFTYIFNCLTQNGDSIKKNTLWGTYANGKVFPMLWDLDNQYGVGWIGTQASGPSAGLWAGSYATSKWPLALLWALYSNEIKTTYASLRNSKIISIETWKDIVFGQWVDRIGKEAFERDIEKWPETPSYREDYTNKDYWTYYSYSYGRGSYSLWDENSEYAKDALVAMSLHPLSNRYYIYKAVQANHGQCPVSQFYTEFPMLGGFFDSPKRWEKWMTAQIGLCDAVMEYNNNN